MHIDSVTYRAKESGKGETAFGVLYGTPRAGRQGQGGGRG